MIAIFGGSFDPIHAGHLGIAKKLYASLTLSEIRFLPCRKNALGKKSLHTKTTHRLSMLHIALTDFPHFTIDCQEINRKGPSYTVDTLSNIRSQIPDKKALAFILGLDALQTLPQWHDWKRILQLAHLIVIPRPNYTSGNIDHVASYPRCANMDALRSHSCGHLFFCDLPPSTISSTQIRQQYHDKQLTDRDLPISVYNYMYDNKVYG